RLRPLFRARGDAVEHEAFEPGRHVVLVLARALGARVTHRVEQLFLREAGVEAALREQLPEHHAEREEIEPPILGPTRDLLRREVADLAAELAFAGSLRAAAGLRDPEVHELHLA